MCLFQTRVSRCGHYTKILVNPCKEAKEKEEVCESGSEDSSTTGGFCFIEGCDKKPGLIRDGPSQSLFVA